jgi:hypothetical protein
MTEPDVALTDYGLTVLCAVLAHFVYRRGTPGNAFRDWFTLFFLATGAAALFGGTVHGFFEEEGSAGHAILWRATMVSIGAATLAGWAIAAQLLLSDRLSRLVTLFAGIQVALYVLLVLFLVQDFRVAIFEYLPAALFMLIGLARAYWRDRVGALAVAAAGMVLTFVAAAVQQAGIGLHPVYFNHNALYHLIQAIALVMLFLGARHLSGGNTTTGEPDSR